MKKTILVLTFLSLCTFYGFSQSNKYTDAMKSRLEQYKGINNPDSLNELSATFERIASAEKTQWLPFYYAALSKIQAGYMNPKANKDEVAKAAETLILKGVAIDNNSEFAVLRYMNAILQLMVDPMQRFMTFGPEAEQIFASTIAKDPNNPRMYLVKARTVENTPVQFGGGKEAAKQYYQKAIEAAATKKSDDPLLPNWGVDDAQKALEAK